MAVLASTVLGKKKSAQGKVIKKLKDAAGGPRKKLRK
jgi:hypothetical protein